MSRFRRRQSGLYLPERELIAPVRRGSLGYMAAAIAGARIGGPAAAGGGGGGQPPLHQFFNSSEPGGDGSDSNVLWADNFERGYWFLDTANPSVENAGWHGTPFGDDDPQGTNFGRANQGVGGGYCVTQGGRHTTENGQARAMGDHSLAEAVSELYFRYYVKPLTGYLFGQEKALTLNKNLAGFGGIDFGTMFFGLFGTPEASCEPSFLEKNADQNRFQNQVGELELTGGDNWYYIELHLKINGTGGTDLLEMWGDNCGPDGTDHPAEPTLVMRHTDMTLRPPDDPTALFRSIWLENWAGPASVGEMYYDQIMCKTTGPIGFADV